MDIGCCTDDAPDGGWRCRCRAAPVGRPRCARGGGPLAAPDGARDFCPLRGQAGRSFPLAGKNQRATGGSQSETAPWLPPGPSPLGLMAKPHVERGYSLPRGGGLERLWVLCLLSAGGRAAPVGRPRCARGGGPWGVPVRHGGSFARCAGKQGCSFPLAGKNQRAPGGSQTETAPWLPPDSSPLGLGAEPHVTRGYSLPRGGGLERL